MFPYTYINKQFNDIKWAGDNYPSVAVWSDAAQRARDLYKNDPTMGAEFQPGEMFSNPSDVAYQKGLDSVFWNLEDYRSTANTIDDSGQSIGPYVNLGLAGALDDAFTQTGLNWEDEWKRDNEHGRELMIDALNAIEVPVGYFSTPLSNEARFVKFYGISYKPAQDPSSVTVPLTEAQKSISNWKGIYEFKKI